jgi:hypothetical protein
MAKSLGDVPEKTKSASVRLSRVWRKSTRSIVNGACVEAAKLLDGRLAVRDSFDEAGPRATFMPSEWRAFVKRIKNGDLDAI